MDEIQGSAGSESQPDSESQSGSEFELSPADRAAVDAFFDGDQSDVQRLDAVTRLLGMLDTPIAGDHERAARIDVTALRAASINTEPQLDIASASSVDDWMESNEPLTARDETHGQIASLITAGASYSDQERDSLVNRTLGLIQEEVDRSEKRYIMDMPISPGGRFRLADLVSLAATLLLIASVTIPVLGGIRSRSMQAQCNNNMAIAGTAFGTYAGSNRDRLPMATAGFGSTWMDVGSTPERSNSSNLFLLVRTKHASIDDLACPTNPDALIEASTDSQMDWRSLDEISYSLRIMTPEGMKMHDAQQPVRVVLLSDRSPVTRRIAAKQPVRPEENTPNHNHTGQHVLGLDGSSQWHRDPILDQGDNLWFPRPIEQIIYDVRDRLGILKGTELPSGANDAFVGP